MTGPSAPVWSLGAQNLGRSDFVRLIHDGGIPAAIAAELTGLVLRETESQPIPLTRVDPQPELPDAAVVVDDAPASASEQEPAPPIWRAIGPVVHVTYAQDNKPEWIKSGPPLERLGSTQSPLPATDPLVPLMHLGCVLRQQLCAKRGGSSIDFERLVHVLAQQRAFGCPPRIERRAWPERLQLYRDHSDALACTRDDQQHVYRWFNRWYPRHRFENVLVQGKTRRCWRNNRWVSVRPPDKHTAVVALTDLGMAQNRHARQEFWVRLRNEAEHHRARAVALVLCPRRKWHRTLIRGWRAVEWERSSPRLASVQPASVMHSPQTLLAQLLALLSPCLRVEPTLLRSTRKLLAECGADLGTELDAWSSPDVEVRSRRGMAFDPAARNRLLPEFTALDPGLRKAFEQLLRHHHASLAPTVRAEELLALGSEPALRDASDILERYSRHLDATTAVNDSELLYIERLARRAPVTAWRNQHLTVVWALTHRNQERTAFLGMQPEGIETRDALWTLSGKRRCWARIMQSGTTLQLKRIDFPEEPLPQGAHLADLPLRAGILRLRWLGARASGPGWIIDAEQGGTVQLPESDSTSLEVASDLATLEIRPQRRPAWAKRLYRGRLAISITTQISEFEWREPEKRRALTKVFVAAPKAPAHSVTREREFVWPPWASSLHHDEWGLLAVLSFSSDLTMRLRWIPPGRFLMGAPKEETERLESEGPQHWVQLSRGLWLAETACTQAQWRAVMANNPSHFTDDERCPVEQVSFDDCQKFCQVLNGRHPGLGARLPTEAEWEYACRAGRSSAYNDGSACMKPEGKDPALEPLAWYSGNSGQRTHPVGEKAANEWGLFDMHGNVYEWCRDWFGPYTAEEQRDPEGVAAGQNRVFRGGSWYHNAWNCRAACRSRYEPGLRWNYVGFRLALTHAGGTSKVGKP